MNARVMPNAAALQAGVAPDVGIDEPVMNARVMPNAAALQAGIQKVAPAVAGGVAARSDRDLLSASERTALASEEAALLLRRMLENPSMMAPAYA
jgi:hypothetical protein